FTKFTGRRFGAKELERTSNEAAVVVREPPLDGRPAGYRMGDVGNYKLSAEVTPRETRVGETVAVEVRLTGRGSLPTALKIPERTGVEWLDPERKEEIEVENGKVSGWRLFRYAVRFTKEGNTELGTVELPFFDEERGVYETASVDLGEVRILARKDGSSADTKGEEDPFATVAKPRQSLGEYQADRDRGVAPALLWTLVLVPPVGVTLSGFVWSVARGMRRRRRDRDNDPAVLARRALTELEPKTDPKDSAALAERALHLAIEAATGIKSRGVMLEELSKRLEDAGLAPELVADTTELLQAASKVRFDPEPEQEAADRVAKRAPAVVTRLLRAKNGKRSESKAA
ncbi:MAG TPA: BatD family protein, partial [Polyangiaceae bacterium]|nr:BatD family protein [Polyangiaceae bacterium]